MLRECCSKRGSHTLTPEKSLLFLHECSPFAKCDFPKGSRTQNGTCYLQSYNGNPSSITSIFAGISAGCTIYLLAHTLLLGVRPAAELTHGSQCADWQFEDRKPSQYNWVTSKEVCCKSLNRMTLLLVLSKTRRLVPKVLGWN
jgi:hypothetical protein